MKNFASQRPPSGERKFVNASIEAQLSNIRADIVDEELSWMFENAYPNTPDTTVFHSEDASDRSDTYVITGDIEAMWLRDSTAQVWPFLRLATADAELRKMLRGVIRRQAWGLRLDPYANAFYREAVFGEHRTDLTEMLPGVHERKWELDSLAAFLRLSCGYWKSTNDIEPFDADWLGAMERLLETARTEQKGLGFSRYSFQRATPEGCSLPASGVGDPYRPCGLIRSAYRPSDDLCKLPFHVPANAMISTFLMDVVPLLKVLNVHPLAEEAARISIEVRAALKKHALVQHPVHGRIWAYEIDGYGGCYLMDDANAPSLLALPYFGFSCRQDPDYLRTRNFVLSEDNPYFHRHCGIEGVGSPHTAHGTIWPLSIIMRALTSESDDEILRCLRMLTSTHAGTGFLHEAFHPENPAAFSRSWFAWANTLFGELIVSLWDTRRHILQTKLS